jgi:hypothetical protein
LACRVETRLDAFSSRTSIDPCHPRRYPHPVIAARPDYRKILAWGAGIIIGLAVLGIAAIFLSIEVGVESQKKQAMARFPGRDPSQALIELVDCEKCGLAERNHAVWALGRIREQRALPVLHKHFYDGPCNHSKFICQHELRNALKRIESQPRVHAKR